MQNQDLQFILCEISIKILSNIITINYWFYIINIFLENAGRNAGFV